MWIFSLKEEEGFVIEMGCEKEARIRVIKVWRKDEEEVVFIGISPPAVFSSFKKELVFPGKEDNMLVLSRKKDERIIIGDSIVVTVVKINDGKVKLGIEAPEGVSIWREEIYNAIKQKEENSPSS